MARSLQVEGEISYNGRDFGEFVPLRTATYVEQSDTVSFSILSLHFTKIMRLKASASSSKTIFRVLKLWHAREAPLPITAQPEQLPSRSHSFGNTLIHGHWLLSM